MTTMRRSHIFLALTVAAGSLLAASPAQAAIEPALPPPTGDHPVGLATLHLTDRDRPDPWKPEAGPRQLMVSLWYPAAKATGRPAPYVTPQESAAILKPYPDLPPGTLTATKTNARVGAPVWPAGHGLPLVLVSPGFTFPRATMTSLGEDLASRGYLVAAVEHTYESVATTFPDGTTTGCDICSLPNTEANGAKLAAGRVKDLSFVLDRLTGKSTWGRLVDKSEIGMVGFSLGGGTTPQLMIADRRVRAGVDLDGTINPKKPDQPVRRPLLLLGADTNHRPGGDVSWDQWWPQVKSWKRWLTVKDTDHSSFTDYAVLRPQVGLPAPALDGARTVELTRDYVAAFLDQSLLHRKRKLLDGPSEGNPEVAFHQPGK
jgi:dienelactone hydrolase